MTTAGGTGQQRPAIRVGSGLDVHAFAGGEDRPLVLGGVQIRSSNGLAGHSDADALAHAITDALLGAAGLGDLGTRFGVDRPETAGADSLTLLAAVVADLATGGWAVGNVDATVVAQAPRLGPFRDRMRTLLAGSMAVPLEVCSVKFTTTDRLGTIGRGEGIACWATAMIVAA